MKSRTISIMLALALILSCAVFAPVYADEQKTATGSAADTDIEIADETWDKEAAEWAAKTVLSDRTYSWNSSAAISRAEAVTFLWKAAGSPVVNYAMPFKDVEEDAFYTEAARWAASEKILLGVSEDTFAPALSVTREQLAALIYRYAQSKGEGFSGLWMFLLDFEDASAVSNWADEAMHWCVMNGVINGVGGGKLDSQGTTTLKQACTVLYRVFK